jgi:hypothetical protein
MSEKKERKRRMLSEGIEEGSVAPLELFDGVMEQVEAMAKELRRISGGIEALVEVVRRLTMGLGKKEVEKEDKGTETEIVRRVDQEVVTEIVEEESESEEEEEEKGDDGKKDGEEEMEAIEQE